MYRTCTFCPALLCALLPAAARGDAQSLTSGSERLAPVAMAKLVGFACDAADDLWRATQEVVNQEIDEAEARGRGS